MIRFRCYIEESKLAEPNSVLVIMICCTSNHPVCIIHTQEESMFHLFIQNIFSIFKKKLLSKIKFFSRSNLFCVMQCKYRRKFKFFMSWRSDTEPAHMQACFQDVITRKISMTWNYHTPHDQQALGILLTATAETSYSELKVNHLSFVPGRPSRIEGHN